MPQRRVRCGPSHGPARRVRGARHDGQRAPPHPARSGLLDKPPRLVSLDLLRGLAMVLMVLDHSDVAWDAGHLSSDSVAMHRPGAALPAPWFLTRWLSHLCAPTFLFLAGTSLALGLSRGLTRRDMALRGLVLVALELLLVTFLWWPGTGAMIVLQVIWVIGLSMLAMSLLSRLPTWLLLGASLAWLAGGELLTRAHWNGSMVGSDSLATLLLAPGYWPAGSGPFGWTGLPAVEVYPLLPWLSLMVLGWGFGRLLLARRAVGRPVSGLLLCCGAGALALFAVLRGLDGYGNMDLLREGPGLVQWLHVSKYPPSLTFVCLELGIMALILGWLLRRDERGAPTPTAGHPLLVFGRSALCFYVLHIALVTTLGGLAPFTPIDGAGGLAAPWGVTLLALALLYRPCQAWIAFKRARPDGWRRLF